MVPPISLAAHTMVANTSASPGTNTTPPIDTTGAKLLILAVSDYTNIANDGTVSDSKGNTWIPLTPQPNNNNEIYKARIFYVANPIVGTLHTFSHISVGTPSYETIYAAAFSGVKTASPFDVENGATGSSSTPTLQPGSITPSQANELVVTACTVDSLTGAPTVSAGFDLIDSAMGVNGLSVGGGLAFQVQTIAAAVNPTWTSDNNVWAAVIASFKAP